MFLNRKRTFLTKIKFLIFWTKNTFLIKITDYGNSIKTLFYSFNSQHYRNEMHFSLKVFRKTRLALNGTPLQTQFPLPHYNRHSFHYPITDTVSTTPLQQTQFPLPHYRHSFHYLITDTVSTTPLQTQFPLTPYRHSFHYLITDTVSTTPLQQT